MPKSLTDTLNVYEKVKYRWVSAFKFNLHNITRLSLAKVAQASMMGSTSHWLMLFTMTLHIQRVFKQNGRTE